MTTKLMGAPVADDHHRLPVHEVVLVLETDPQRGLTNGEARRRLAAFGPNTLPVAQTARPLLRLLRQFHHPLIHVLIAAGLITAALREYVDSTVIFGIVLINAVVGFIQESKAEAALDSLRRMVRTDATVVRDGQRRIVPSDHLVPGDLVVLEAGDKVPADMRLVRVEELRVDESALTGESEPVTKDEVLLPETTPVADRRNMAYSGTLVTTGGAAGIAVATGAGTELGQIHRLVGAVDQLATPLTKKLAKFSALLTVVILVMAVLTFGIGVWRGQEPVDTLTAAIALAVGAIPEGLPAAVTITLAIGVSRMARRRAVLRRLPVAETLGSTTVICSDKTGTLTENAMTVRTLWTPEGEFQVSGTGYGEDGAVYDAAGNQVTVSARNPVTGSAGTALDWCLTAAAACNDAAIHGEGKDRSIAGDPTEAALLVAARKVGIDAGVLSRTHVRTGTVPFSPERQYMATLHRSEEGAVVLTKGAVERMVRLCSHQLGADGVVEPLDRSAVITRAEQLAGQGLRVLATAVATAPGLDELTDADLPGKLVLTGLVAMHDPPRYAAAGAVRACHTAGITVKMITGDHAATARAIARQVGLLDDDHDHPGAVVTSTDLSSLPAKEYADVVDRATVFARVSPEQKLRLVAALQDHGHVVAVTGDGVNDAPALRQADIGVAMGRSGTEVAKDAADMVLLDDDFATIEAAVEEGRGVFDNLTKFIVWTLPTNMGEGLVILVAILLGAALPILPTQILWINMTTAVALGLMLAFEPKEPGIMQRRPRDPAEPLLTRSLVARVLLVSTLLVGGSWWLFQWELARGASLPEARTAALNVFVVVEGFYLFSCRSLTRSAWQLGIFTNRWLLVGVGVQALAQLAITYLPAMQALFQTAPISLESWSRILFVGLLSALVVSTHKRLLHVRASGLARH